MKLYGQSGVYWIKNLVNKKVYVGSAVFLGHRRNEHFSKLDKNIHPNQYLQNSFNKHGRKCFAFEVLVLCDKNMLVQYEQMLLDGLSPDYNILTTAYSSLGYTHTEEAKKKIGVASRGRKLSKSTRRKMSLSKKGENHPLYGTNRSEETKRRMSESLKGREAWNKGVPRSEETKRKIRKTKRANPAGRKLRKEQVTKIRRLYKTGEYTQTKLGKIFGVAPNTVSQIVNRKIWTHV